jgi:hypothetical protein
MNFMYVVLKLRINCSALKWLRIRSSSGQAQQGCRLYESESTFPHAVGSSNLDGCLRRLLLLLEHNGN